MKRIWFLESVVLAMHDEQVAEHGGVVGVRDANLLASAMARPQNLAAYGNPSVFDLAAGYAFGIIKNHPFLDGNKRTGFLAAYAFLDLNGWELSAPETEAVMTVVDLAKGSIDEADFAQWLKKNSVKRARKK